MYDIFFFFTSEFFPLFKIQNPMEFRYPQTSPPGILRIFKIQNPRELYYPQQGGTDFPGKAQKAHFIIW